MIFYTRRIHTFRLLVFHEFYVNNILNISNTLDEKTLHCKTNNTLRVLNVEWKERCSHVFLSHYLEQTENLIFQNNKPKSEIHSIERCVADYTNRMNVLFYDNFFLLIWRCLLSLSHILSENSKVIYLLLENAVTSIIHVCVEKRAVLAYALLPL